nr:hypothetical protein [Tanacetum cinerariifolium]
LLDLVEILIGDGPRLSELEQRAHGLGVDGCEAIDDTCGIEEDNGTQLLAQAAVDLELGVVDLGVERDLVMPRDDGVRHLAAD